MGELLGIFRVWLEYFSLHFRASLAYRKSFWLQIAGMFVNNLAFVFIWLIFFERFPEALFAKGINLRHALLLFSLMSSAYGFMAVFCGGAFVLGTSIVQNSLDNILVLPRPPYFISLIAKSYVSGWGDLVFGLALFCVSQPLTVAGALLFLFYTVLSGMMFAATVMILQSLNFYLGNSEPVSRLGLMGMLLFGTYPEEIFPGAVKLIFYTVLPVGIFVYLPVKEMLAPSAAILAGSVAASALVIYLSVRIFNAGLSRYESGNLMTALK